MDLVPFLEINMINLKDSSINELRKFCKENFDKEKIFSTAEELKYSSLIKGVLSAEFEAPSEEFVRLVLTNIYDGQKNQRVIEKFTPVVKRRSLHLSMRLSITKYLQLLQKTAMM